ncbi:MAG TPA: hypothetical protein VNG33_03905 [Polyangiaceae bacterium]|nr:hypothetical protein [Polyangiaceae bacterium]
MSNRSIRQILIVAFGVTLSGIALARNPPALVQQQQAAAHATRASGGYRDINVRFGAVALRSPRVMRAAGGYRDMNYRFPGGSLGPAQMASTSTSSRWR